MTKSLLWLLQASMLAVLFQPIVCPNGEMYVYRRDRSSHIDPNKVNSDSVNNLMDSRIIENRSRKTQQQQHTYSIEPNNENATNTNLNETIRSIFKLGPDLKLFNTTLNPHITPISEMQADDSFITHSQNDQQSFKVQRSPDGKLNLVFNDFLFFQRPAERPAPTRRKNSDFVFPGQQIAETEPKCEDGIYEGKPFCTKVLNYPELTQLETILRREFSKFEVFFGEDLVQPQNITQRMNNEPLEQHFCGARETVIYPQGGLTQNNEKKFILNDEHWKQGVRIEECLNEGATCNFLDSLPNSYKVTCKQKYIYRSLVAISESETNKTVTKEHFRFPSCCECILIQE